MAAMQAQDYPGAKWSLGLRLLNNTDGDIERAISGKTILRTWLLRGTLHFVAAQDIHWMLALVAPRIIRGNSRRYRELELDERSLTRSTGLLVKALQGNRQLTRKALFSILEQNGVSTKGQRGIYMLQRASLDGFICQGTMHSNDPSFMSLDEIPSLVMNHDIALAELALRYFTTRSPASIQDFTWWSGLAAGEARTALESVQSKLLSEKRDDKVYWRSPSFHPAVEKSQVVLLLPGFDEFLLSYKDRSGSMDFPNYRRATPTNGILPPTININGHVIGVWKRIIKKDTVRIELYPFEPLSSKEREIVATEAKRFGEFLGLSVVLA